MNKIINKLRRKIFNYPSWLNHPNTIQIDTQNYCNLDCEYCNVKEGLDYGIDRGIMKLSLIERVLKAYKNVDLWCVAPFLNGDPLLERRLHKICDMVKEINNVQCVIDTNGSIYANRELLIHSNLKIVRFTISAMNKDTYLKVHGKDLFKDVLKTLDYFIENKFKNQKCWIYFITTKNNVNEIFLWLKFFKDFDKSVFPIHTHELQQSSKTSKTNTLNEMYQVYKDGKIIYPHQKIIRDKIKPCQCWDIQAIGINGELLHCSDFPYKYNWGNMITENVFESWRKRNLNKMDHVCCNSCSLRFNNYNEMFTKDVLRGIKNKI